MLTERSTAPVDIDPATAEAAERLRTGRPVYVTLKRCFDIIFSLCVLVLFSWLYLLIALAIKVDDPHGSVIFAQDRVGRYGKVFRMYKFRTMVEGAEDLLDDLRARNEKDGPAFKLKDDPRITRVGKFLRKMSLDELPQFVNVLRGDISIVGPRPALPHEVAQYTPRQRQRLDCHQGLTCYWQTRLNRDDISFDEWMALDRLYIKQCSVWADVKLIIQTISVVLAGQGN